MREEIVNTFASIISKNYSKPYQKIDYACVLQTFEDNLGKYIAMAPKKLEELFCNYSIISFYSNKWDLVMNSLQEESSNKINSINKCCSEGLRRLIIHIPDWFSIDNNTRDNWSLKLGIKPEDIELNATRRFQHIVFIYMYTLGVLGVDVAENVAINLHEKYKNDYRFLSLLSRGLAYIREKGRNENNDLGNIHFQSALWFLNNERIYPYEIFAEEAFSKKDWNVRKEVINKSAYTIDKIESKFIKGNTTRMDSEDIRGIERRWKLYYPLD